MTPNVLNRWLEMDPLSNEQVIADFYEYTVMRFMEWQYYTDMAKKIDKTIYWQKVPCKGR